MLLLLWNREHVSHLTTLFQKKPNDSKVVEGVVNAPRDLLHVTIKETKDL